MSSSGENLVEEGRQGVEHVGLARGAVEEKAAEEGAALLAGDAVFALQPLGEDHGGVQDAVEVEDDDLDAHGQAFWSAAAGRTRAWWQRA
jgi:hypothetical protein